MGKLGLIVVMNVRGREAEGRFLQRVAQSQTDLPVEVCVDETMAGTCVNFRNRFATGENTGTHRMIMQDDITLDRGIIAKAVYILEHAPDNAFVSIYAPDNTDFREAYFAGHKILKSPANFWLQCCIYPDAEMKGFFEWYDAELVPCHTGIDTRLSFWLGENNKAIYTVVPGLVQHLGAFRSTLGTPGMVGKNKRWSKWYDAGINVDQYNWSEEFKNPYYAKMKLDPKRIQFK